MISHIPAKSVWRVVPVLNITIITYIYLHPDILPGLPYTGPGFELGAQHLRERYNFNATLIYVGDENIRSIADLVADVYRVAEFYYGEWDRNGLVALILPGRVLGLLTVAEMDAIMVVYFVLEPFEQKRQYGYVNYRDPLDPANDEDAAEAFRSLLKIGQCAPRNISKDLDKFLAILSRMSADEYGFHYPTGEKPHEMVMAAYAGMEVYGKIVSEALHDGSDLFDSQALVRRAFNRTFHLRFSEVFVDEYGERRNNYCVSDFNITSKAFEGPLLEYLLAWDA
ncbi:hypothetical protein RvY_19052 [Ramazzottius varieornatus]|uniref:Receptor ligand binding region domain-containing protein n=1 Tax=Ramazzottius varieornatus TaxID=947166 RepID=A0A1D1W817_RAMVA|nr:hypothetical protein RvY_19052 [Ramazzottius varieornatus]